MNSSVEMGEAEWGTPTAGTCIACGRPAVQVTGKTGDAVETYHPAVVMVDRTCPVQIAMDCACDRECLSLRIPAEKFRAAVQEADR